jgi:gliding motility-associated lipoprotein GldH
LKQFIFIALISLSLAGCFKTDVFEKTIAFQGEKWTYDNSPSFSFDISDTSSLYNIYLIVRHTDAYKYNNIWLKVEVMQPGDTLRTSKLDVGLGSDAAGWDGTGMDDIYEYRKALTARPIPLKRAGKYTFTVSQIMRENPIGHILNVGIRVEKVKQ